MRPKLCLLIVLALGAGCATAPALPKVAANAPPDQAIQVTGNAQIEEIEKDLEPCVEAARATLPDAMARFQKGLPKGQVFSVTVRLRDEARHFEQAYVAVDRIQNGRVEGRIWTELQLVRNYHAGQAIVLPESEVLDWTISRPDGTEEGNLLGNHLESGAPCTKPAGK